MTITINGTTGITQPADNLAGSSSGTVTVQPAAAAGTWTMTLPTTAGTNGYVLGTDGTGVTNWVATAGALPTPTTAGNVIFTTDGSTWSSTQKIVRGASVSPSGTLAAAFTNLPSWVKRVTVQFSALTSATANATMVVQLGTGATPTYTTSGYVGILGQTFNGSASAATAFSSGFIINASFAANSPLYGTVTLTNLTGTSWIGTVNLGRTGTLMSGNGGGVIDIGATLTAVQILSSANYNGGTVNILYE